MLELIEVVEVEEAPPQREPICKDYDEDCEDLPNHLHCWLHDMGQGRCPYLTNDK